DCRAAVAGRHSTVCRLLCQAVPISDGDQRWQRWFAAAGDLGADHVRGLAVLLRARDPRDVDAGCGRGRAGPPGELQPGSGAGREPRRCAGTWHLRTTLLERGCRRLVDLWPLTTQLLA